MHISDVIEETWRIGAALGGGAVVLHLISCWNEPAGFFRLLPKNDLEWAHYWLRTCILLQPSSMLVDATSQIYHPLVGNTLLLFLSSAALRNLSPNLSRAGFFAGSLAIPWAMFFPHIVS